MPVKRDKQLTEMLYSYMDNKHPTFISRKLRRILTGYLSFEMQAGVNTDLREEIELMSGLMDIMDSAEQISSSGPNGPA